MKQILLFFFIFFVFVSRINAQTVFWKEDFETGGSIFTLNTTDVIAGKACAGASPFNQWIINNSYDPTYSGSGPGLTQCPTSTGINYAIVTTPSQPGAVTNSPNSYYLHIHSPIALQQKGISNANWFYAGYSIPLLGIVACPPAENYFAKMNTAVSTLGKTNVTLKFWWANGAVNLFGRVYYSINGGTTWTQLGTNLVGQLTWKQQSYSLPVFDNQPDLRFAFAWISPEYLGAAGDNDPAFSVDDIALEIPTPPTTITTGVVTGSPFCACDNVSIPFTSSGTFNAGNIYTAELSNASGSFTGSAPIGTLSSTANSGTISGTIPCNTPTGTQYRIRVTGSTPTTIGADNGANIAINASGAVSVSISTPSAIICTGAPATFNASAVNGGTPSFQWKKNGVDVGTNSSTYTDNSLVDGDAISCELTSNAPCVTGSPATSNTITISVTTSLPASVSIASSATTICAGTNVSFDATAQNPGTNPVYQWKVNGNSAGSNSPSFNTSALSNGDSVTCTMTSNSSCVAGSPVVTSASVIINVSGGGAVGTVTAVRDTICSGTPAILSVTGGSGGGQWQSSLSPVGGFSNAGTIGTSFIDLPAQTTYYRIITGTGACADSSAAKMIHVTLSPVSAFSYMVSGKHVDFNSDDSKNATSFIWRFDDGTASVSTPNPSHDYLANGVYHVCLDALNGSNCSFTTCRDVYIGGVGIEDISYESDWKVFPVPFGDYLYVDGGEKNKDVKVIQIYDLLGREIIHLDYTESIQSPAYIDVAGLIKGMYVLKIKTAHSQYVQSVLKQ